MDSKVEELQTLVKELRDKAESGLYTKAEFKEFQEKINDRIEQLETKMNRPPVDASKESKEPSENKAAFFKFMREGKAALAPEERKALVENDTGQILVPEELEAEIYRELPKLSVIRGLATVRQVRSNRIRRRSLDEVTVGWGKIETTYDDVPPSDLTTPPRLSSLTPTEEYQYVEDLYGLTKIGEDELMDTDVALESIVIDSFSRAIAETEDKAFVVGNGHNATNPQPEGMLYTYTSGSDTVEVVERVDATGATDAPISADDILKLIYEVPAQYRANGVLIVNSKTELALRLLKDSNDQYLWQPSLQAGRPSTFAGYPIYNQDDMPVVETAAGDYDVAIFGDVRSGYRIIDRLGVTIQRLTELYAEQGLVGFKAHYRVGGSVIRPNALRVLRVTVSTSTT